MMIDHQREHDFEDIRDSARERSRSRIPKLAAERNWPRHAERSDLGLGGCPMTALGWLRVIRTAWVLGGYYWVEGEWLDALAEREPEMACGLIGAMTAVETGPRGSYVRRTVTKILDAHITRLMKLQ